MSKATRPDAPRAKAKHAAQEPNPAGIDGLTDADIDAEIEAARAERHAIDPDPTPPVPSHAIVPPYEPAPPPPIEPLELAIQALTELLEAIPADIVGCPGLTPPKLEAYAAARLHARHTLDLLAFGR